MRISFIQLVSILIVSDNGSKLDSLVASLRDYSFDKDESTQLTKTYLIKYGFDKNRAAHYRVGGEMYNLLIPYLKDIPEHFCGRECHNPPPLN